jgi:hypothetical protein
VGRSGPQAGGGLIGAVRPAPVSWGRNRAAIGFWKPAAGANGRKLTGFSGWIHD